MVQKIEIPVIVKDDGSVVLGKIGDKFDEVDKKAKKAQGSTSEFASSLLSGVGLGAGFKATEFAADALLAVVKVLPASFAAWTGEALAAADKLSNLSATTGLTAEQLQKLERLGAPTGVSLETMAKEVLKLQRNLELAPKAFEQYGLSVEHLKSLEPDQAFREVAKAIGEMKDPSEQAAASFKLLGDRSGEMLRVIREGLPAVEDFGELSNEQVSNLDNLGDATGEAKQAWKNLTMQLAATVAQSPEVLAFVKDLAAGIGGLAAMVRDNGKFVTEWFSNVVILTEKAIPALDQFHRIIQLVASNPQITAKHAAPWDPAKIVPPSMDADFAKLFANTEKFGVEAEAAQVKATAAAKKHSDALKKNAADFEDLRSKASNDEARQFQKDSDILINLGRDRSQKMAEDFLAECEEEQAARAQANEGILEMQDALGAALREQRQREAEENRAWWADLSAMIGGTFGAVLGQATSALFDYGDAMDAARTKAEVFQARVNLAATAVGIFGSLLEAKGSPALQKFGGALQGAAQGAKMGAAFGPWGAAIGAIGGAVLGFLHKAKQLREEMLKIKDSFVQSMGGMEDLKKHAEAAGVSLDAIWKAKDKKHLLSAIDEVKAKLQTWDDAHEALNAAIEKYGFSVEELGPKMAAQKLDEQAQELFKNWSLLTQGGLIPAATVIQKMGPDLIDFVNTSKAAGVSIPENMRPMIEQLITSGQLLDENGVAFTSVEGAGISFAQSLTDGMMEVVKSVRELVAALGGVPAAARDAGRAMAGIPPAPFGGDYGYPDTGKPYQGDMPSYAVGSLNIPRSGPKIVHQGEAIVPNSGPALQRMAALVAGKVASAGGNSGPSHVAATIMMDGKVFGQAVIDLQQSSAQFQANTKNIVAGRRIG